MAEINIYGLEDIKSIVEKIPINRLVFWIGAGIDSGAPTSLPLGNGLTDYILQKTCREKAQDIINIWQKNQKLLNLAVDGKLEISNRPRLETIIEAVREFEEHQIKKQSIIEGLRSFSSKELCYNNEHFLLAQYLHRGANVVTTNYGDFICEAYRKKYGESKLVHEYSDIHIYRVNNIWSSCIYHIHGISSDLKTIGANLTTVKNSLPQSFKEQFKYWIDNGYVIIFMGYSGLDTLDVNPFLETFNNVKGKMGVYVRHSNEENFSEASEKEEKLLHAFNNKYICPCVTKDFFTILNAYDEMAQLKFVGKENNWKDAFSKYAKNYDEDLSYTFLSGLCYSLGISMIEIFGTSNWLPKVMQSENVDFWYKHYYSFENAVITKQKKIIKNQGRLLRNKSDSLMESDYQAGRGRRPRKINRPHEMIVREVKEKIESNQMVGWDISTKLNRYIEYVLFDTIKNNLFFSHVVRVKKEDRENVKNAEECLGIILKGGYDYVIDVRQICTAYRTLALCQVILGEDIAVAINNLNIALENYADISSVNGVGKILIYKALVYLIDYRNEKNYNSLKQVENILKRVKPLIFKCGLKKYYSSYYFVKIYWIVLNSSKWLNKINN